MHSLLQLPLARLGGVGIANKIIKAQMITTSPINRLQHYSCLLALEQPARQIHFPTKPIVTQNNASRTLAGDLDA